MGNKEKSVSIVKTTLPERDFLYNPFSVQDIIYELPILPFFIKEYRIEKDEAALWKRDDYIYFNYFVSIDSFTSLSRFDIIVNNKIQYTHFPSVITALLKIPIRVSPGSILRIRYHDKKLEDIKDIIFGCFVEKG